MTDLSAQQALKGDIKSLIGKLLKAKKKPKKENKPQITPLNLHRL